MIGNYLNLPEQKHLNSHLFMQENFIKLFFKGHWKRNIIENPSNFYRILLLEIDYGRRGFWWLWEIIVRNHGCDVIEGELYFLGGNCPALQVWGEQQQISYYDRKTN